MKLYSGFLVKILEKESVINYLVYDIKNENIEE